MSETLKLAYGGLHPDRVTALLDSFGGPGRVLAGIRSGRIKVGDEVRRAVTVSTAKRRHALEATRITFVERGDSGYPQHLADLPGAPPGLFARGAIPSVAGVAVVGTRRCTSYGLKLAFAYGSAIASAGWPLVSGLARGIDGAAHRGTVDGGGVGVAVLGNGLGAVYPREHVELAENLIDVGGAVISEYPPDAKPYGWRFPPRNRIISGLSRAVVVVEAGVKGGALITARLALEQGVSVFAVPGDVGRESSRGCNLLIRDGAHPVLDPEDLIEELALVLGPPRPSRRVLGDESEALFGLLASAGALSVDAAAMRLEVPVDEVLVAAVGLEASGLVEFDGATLRASDS